MALRTYIPINDSSSECFLYYIVEYKASTDIGYSTAPVAYGSPAVINGLLEGVEYSIRITKVCCDNTQGTPTTITYTPQSGGLPFTIISAFNATTGLNAEMGVVVQFYNPFQEVYNNNTNFSASGAINNSGIPVSSITTMPATGYMALSNPPSNGVAFDYEIDIKDQNDGVISGTSFPYTGTILSNQTINFDPVSYGDGNGNGYKITVTLTDPT